MYIKFLNIDSLSIRTYTDTSFNNHSNGGSKGGQITFIADNENQSCPLAWNSSKIKRVVRSTLATETLSMTDGCDASFFTTEIVNHIFQRRTINNAVIKDNKSLLDSIQSTNLISDRRLRVELHHQSHMYEKSETEIIWSPISKQISSNVLTRRGDKKIN